MSYILGIDQSTQGTKAILVDAAGEIVSRVDKSHRQLVNDRGWVSHDLEEIYQNTIQVCREVIESAGIDKALVRAVGIANQRETTALWECSGRPLNTAVVWQCSRAAEIAHEVEAHQHYIHERTGLKLSAYFPAAKMAWLLRNTPNLPEAKDLRLGTIDTWLIYRLTDGEAFCTDASNASRTQLFDIQTLQWNAEICDLFQIPIETLPEVCDSDCLFGMTDLGGYLEKKIPIHSAMGDSHAALFGQGCHESGMIKTTYGTGSSIMMNIGKHYAASTHGLVTSLAWGIHGEVNYVLEGNINYTGAVVSWLKDDLHLIDTPAETEQLAREANPADQTVCVPAFSGLSAPYWKDDSRAMLYGMTRTTGRNEIVKAALESIALQIQAVLAAMEQDSDTQIHELRVDGGATRNRYLMQLQSDLSNTDVAVSHVEELSALGVAYLAGISVGIYDRKTLFARQQRTVYHPQMSDDKRKDKLRRWNQAIALVTYY